MTNWRESLELINKHPFISTLLGPLLRSRREVMSKVGTTFGGNRKHYEIFGWPVDPSFDYYNHLYKRGGIAKRIVNAYPYATWRTEPIVKESDSQAEETAFEKAWKDLVKAKRIFHYLERVDRMARLGQYAVLFMGFADARTFEELEQPVGALPTKASKLLYLQPYNESRASVYDWEQDPTNERFGLPKLYQIQLNTPAGGASRFSIPSRTINVHWSRVLHVPEDLLDSDTEGTPALEAVINMILDLEKVCGAAAEAFFQQTPPATIFSTPPEANVDTTTMTDTTMQDNIDDFVNGFKRWLVLQGFNVETLKPTIGDPSQIASVLLDLISGTTGIPKRILIGSERGELASSQDENAWNKRIEERQTNFAEPFILRPFISTLINLGVIPLPSTGDFSIEWQSAQALGEVEQADISQKKSEALSKYVSAPGAEEVMPPDIFLEAILKLDAEVIDRIRSTRQELWDRELEELKNPPEEPIEITPTQPPIQEGIE